jgi:hypothetical protein
MNNYFGLPEYLSLSPEFLKDGSCQLYQLQNYFYTPGFWVSLAALAKSNAVNYENLGFHNTDQISYSQAIQLPRALGLNDSYPLNRVKEGVSYSPLILLDHRDATDVANQQINECIRSQCSELNVEKFVSELCSVVGDLHDNVWSHGQSTGFSMFQRWKKPYSNDDVIFEFALADCGLGFLRELKRVGLDRIDSDNDAITWCLQRGNSSKLIKKIDDWGQRLPPDMMGNPMPGFGVIKETENHHQGIGLAKLIDLVTSFNGELHLATGNSIYSIDKNGLQYFRLPSFPWSGVAISCKFDTSCIRVPQLVEKNDNIEEQLLGFLRG